MLGYSALQVQNGGKSVANEKHLQIIRQGADVWNDWRQKSPELIPDLSGANLRGAHLRGANLCGTILQEASLLKADLSGANLCGAILHEAILQKADLSGANLRGADLYGADLRGANITRANLTRANLRYADLSRANLRGADLSRAYLRRTLLIETDFCGALLAESRIYGASVWDIKVNDKTNQQNLVITPHGQAAITVDNIKVAQFIYLLLNNQEIRDVIDTITSKTVLILGRFSEERKVVLDAIREELRKHDYLPILFDFDVSENRDITETVSLLARLACFIIADLTDPSSIPKELEAIVPSLAVPVQPLLEGLARPYAMFKDYWKYDWVLPPFRYEGLQLLLAALAEKVIAPAEAKVAALEERRRAIEVELIAPRTSA
jgi:uncharacterized protein YjbI with pentapeptide repeats